MKTTALIVSGAAGLFLAGGGGAAKVHSVGQQGGPILGSVAPVAAKLTVLAVREGGGRALFHLRCDPAAGNVAHPAKACAAIAAQPSLVTNPKPFYDGGNNVAYFTITGSLNGKPVHF